MTKKLVATEKKTKMVYFGPTLPGVAKEGTVYIGRITPQLEEACERIPALKDFIVPLPEYNNHVKKLKDPASALFTLYKDIKKNWR